MPGISISKEFREDYVLRAGTARAPGLCGSTGATDPALAEKNDQKKLLTVTLSNVNAGFQVE